MTSNMIDTQMNEIEMKEICRIGKLLGLLKGSVSKMESS